LLNKSLIIALCFLTKYSYIGGRFNRSYDYKTANIIGKNWLVSNSL